MAGSAGWKNKKKGVNRSKNVTPAKARRKYKVTNDTRINKATGEVIE